jgi:DNA-binding MurR/RpiR family transcriptional regulator
MSISGAGARGEVHQAIAAALARLPGAERRVAEVVLRDPEAVAFGTVAAVAERARTSGPSVVRLADRLGYRGFVGLQQAVQRDLRRRLRPAVERIRSAASERGDLLDHALSVELSNVRLSLEPLDRGAFETAVDRLADPAHRVTILPSEQARGIGEIFGGELGLVRDGVRIAGGSEFRVVTQLARLEERDTVVILDLQRHERWLVEASERAAAAGAARIVIVDSEISPLAEGALAVLPVAAAGVGPFDSQIGVLAVANALLAGVALRLRRSVTRRIDALEAAWTDSGALLDVSGDGPR